MPCPASASVAHLKVNGTAMVASLAASSNTSAPQHAQLQIGAVRRPDIGPQVAHDGEQRGLALGGDLALQRRARTRIRIYRMATTGRTRAPSHIGLHHKHPENPTLRYRAAPRQPHLHPRALLPQWSHPHRACTALWPNTIPGRTLTPAPAAQHPLPMSTIKSICVYCASGPGNDPAFMERAKIRSNPRRERHPPGLWRRLGWADGSARRVGARPRRRR